jgi:hypothetical protein
MQAALAFALLGLGAGRASTRVPDLLEQGRVLAPQAVTAVDLSDNGRFIAVTTLAFHPDVVFTGHGGRAEGSAFLEDLVRRSEESIRAAGPK